MFKINKELIQNLVNINALLNQLEVKGANNIDIMYNSLFIMKNTLEKLDELNKENNEGIVIDNTPEVG